ncbi:GFA family protein [Roseovarius phycicola]|uniref:GFA family protein n=1 Tax=Roseovarius phycicola TaxID=3080976 RepID=A0ABZ2HIK2_9RHOB
MSVDREPRHRLYCHCSVCQRVYGQPYADVTILPAAAVSVPENTRITFDRYKSPPAIRRGMCPDCKTPVVGFMTYGPGLRLAYIPATAFKTNPPETKPMVHLFYKTRQADVEDRLPKIAGTIASFIAGTPLVLGALFSRR